MYNCCCVHNAYDRNCFKTAYTRKIKDLFAVLKRNTTFHSNSYLIRRLHLYKHIFFKFIFLTVDCNNHLFAYQHYVHIYKTSKRFRSVSLSDLITFTVHI